MLISSKKMNWHLKDLIDLDYFLRNDEREWDESNPKFPAKRDRELYLKHIRPLRPKGQSITPGYAIRAWLEHRRSLETPETGQKRVLPGAVYEEIDRLAVFGFLFMGIIIGSGLALSFLNYKGTEPLNISTYLGGFVLSQILLLLFFLGLSLIRVWKRSPLRSSLIYSLISALMTMLMAKIRRRALKTLTESERDSFEAVMGLIRGKRQIYGSLFYWPVFLLVQIIGIGFNLGVLGATLLKVVGSDIAFGWQSTVQFGATAGHELVRVIALPWSWLVPSEIAYPSPSQIEGSHMVLKDGIYHLATEDLVSWWPFLCFAVLFYGLLPRLILLIFGLLAKRRALGRVDFERGPCERLLHRLVTPQMSTEGDSVDEHPRMKDKKVHGADSSEFEENFRNGELIALIPDEIFDACPDEALDSVIFNAFKYPIRKKFRFGEDEESDRRILDKLSRLKKEVASLHLFILQEAWQPPIKENLTFFKDLRKILDKSSKIKVGLIGRPRPENVFTLVKEEDWEAWHKKLTALGDPYLGLERLVANNGN